MERSVPSGGRCAAHPSRPAHDRCPHCGRLRCARDAGPDADHCALCRAPEPVRAARVDLVATGVVGGGVGVVGAALGQEYVGAHVFSWLFPAIVGLVIAAAAAASTAPPRPAARHLRAAVCGAYAGVSALLDFRFTDLPFGPVGRWLPPLAAAVVAAVVGAELLAREPGQLRKASSPMPPP